MEQGRTLGDGKARSGSSHGQDSGAKRPESEVQGCGEGREGGGGTSIPRKGRQLLCASAVQK